MDFSVTYYEADEEKWNVWTHALGFVLSVVMFPFLMFKAIHSHNTAAIISYAIYGVSMIVLYASSTLYHSAINQKVRYYLNILDHSAVYVLIAGSYAPICLVVLVGRVGWIVFGISWLVAVLGIVFKVYFIGRFKVISILSYLIMGWLIVFFLKPLMLNLPVWGQRWLLFGGIFYSVGAYFYAATKIKFNHAIFHVFVLLGSLCHFITIYYHVV
ncbi:hemolysin III family protein [Wenyingzhuangia sp. 2_MG-2023]|uniref:PAQR family membrane homeostasis protein TrhA n=1 Tax=Wenyingzhuangia sp. 2_MG-2023 TaxID=3062639 RepID=UPI0026E1B8C5|nr:hemolysin III family protein [Wenyingzhuangia sp. 2_MG-2023]MDO6736568.1 hemolysin III family protein [Wenyingzhuangia sp. 2_MG-2023]